MSNNNTPPIEGKTAIEKWIEDETESRYPVKRHQNPLDSPYKSSQKTFRHGIDAVLRYLGLEGVADPKEWVEKMKRLSALQYGGGFTEEDITIQALRKENESLTAQLNDPTRSPEFWEEKLENAMWRKDQEIKSLTARVKELERIKASLPSEGEIEALFPCEIGQKVTMEEGKTYEETINANYFRRQGCNFILSKIKGRIEYGINRRRKGYN